MTGPDTDSELPDLDEDEARRLSLLLRHAFAPTELAPERHEQILRAAFEDPFAAATADELIASERLRQALDGQAGDPADRDLALARALSAAHSPSASPPQVPLIAGPLPAWPSKQRAGRVIYARFGGAAALLAVAAAVLLAVRPGAQPGAGSPNAVIDLPALALAQSRSTAALIQADSAGAPSARIDRIATHRARELRDNRYALWGIR